MSPREPAPSNVIVPLRLLPEAAATPGPEAPGTPGPEAPTRVPEPDTGEAWVARLGRYAPEAAAETRQWDRPMDLPRGGAPNGVRFGLKSPWLIGAGLAALGLAAGGVLGAFLAFSVTRSADPEPVVHALPQAPAEPVPPPAAPLPNVVQDAIQATADSPPDSPLASPESDVYPVDAAAGPPGR